MQPQPQQGPQALAGVEPPTALLSTSRRLTAIVSGFSVISVITGPSLFSILFCILSIAAFKASSQEGANVRVLKCFSRVVCCKAACLLIALVVASAIMIPAISCACDQACVDVTYDFLAKDARPWLANQTATLAQQLAEQQQQPARLLDGAASDVDADADSARVVDPRVPRLRVFSLIGRFVADHTDPCAAPEEATRPFAAPAVFPFPFFGPPAAEEAELPHVGAIFSRFSLRHQPAEESPAEASPAAAPPAEVAAALPMLAAAGSEPAPVPEAPAHVTFTSPSAPTLPMPMPVLAPVPAPPMDGEEAPVAPFLDEGEEALSPLPQPTPQLLRPLTRPVHRGAPAGLGAVAARAARWGRSLMEMGPRAHTRGSRPHTPAAPPAPAPELADEPVATVSTADEAAPAAAEDGAPRRAPVWRRVLELLRGPRAQQALHGLGRAMAQPVTAHHAAVHALHERFGGLFGARARPGASGAMQASPSTEEGEGKNAASPDARPFFLVRSSFRVHDHERDDERYFPPPPPEPVCGGGGGGGGSRVIVFTANSGELRVQHQQLAQLEEQRQQDEAAASAQAAPPFAAAASWIARAAQRLGLTRGDGGDEDAAATLTADTNAPSTTTTIATAAPASAPASAPAPALRGFGFLRRFAQNMLGHRHADEAEAGASQVVAHAADGSRRLYKKDKKGGALQRRKSQPNDDEDESEDEDGAAPLQLSGPLANPVDAHTILLHLTNSLNAVGANMTLATFRDKAELVCSFGKPVAVVVVLVAAAIIAFYCAVARTVKRLARNAWTVEADRLRLAARQARLQGGPWPGQSGANPMPVALTPASGAVGDTPLYHYMPGVGFVVVTGPQQAVAPSAPAPAPQQAQAQPQQQAAAQPAQAQGGGGIFFGDIGDVFGDAFAYLSRARSSLRGYAAVATSDDQAQFQARHQGVNIQMVPMAVVPSSQLGSPAAYAAYDQYSGAAQRTVPAAPPNVGSSASL